MKVTAEMIDRAAYAIEECMANDGWQISGINRPRLKRCIRTAAEKALQAAHMEKEDLQQAMGS